MKVLVTGSSGMLGTDLIEQLREKHEVVGVAIVAGKTIDIPFFQIDLTDEKAVDDVVNQTRPAVVIHAAAYTDVDGCENNSTLAFSVNTRATELIGKACERIGAALIFISTDYVFDGTKKSPYKETDIPCPKSIYGESKLRAEKFLQELKAKVLVVRTSWLYGENGKNFFRTILQRAARGQVLRVVNDQVGAPTYTKDLSVALSMMVDRLEQLGDAQGFKVYHVANSGKTSWFGGAKALCKFAGTDVDVKEINSKELGRPAARPANSVLDMTRVKEDFGLEMRSWENALASYWKDSLEREWQALVN